MKATTTLPTGIAAVAPARTEIASYLESLTSLRGIAAVWVVAFHFDSEIVRLTPGWTGIISRGYLWVDFFFLLSGFVICHVYGDRLANSTFASAFRPYIVARFARVYPLHLFTLVLMIVLWSLAVGIDPGLEKSVPPGSFTTPTILQNLALVHAHGTTPALSWNFPSWSIAAEWWTYIAAMFLIPLLQARGIWRASAAIVIGACGLATLEQLHPARNLDINFDYGWLRCLFGFIIGIGIYQLYVARVGQRVLRRDGTFALSALLTVALLHRTAADVLLIPVFALLLLSTVHNDGHTCRLLAARPMRFLGNCSYSIYLMQVPCILPFWAMLVAPGVLDNSGNLKMTFPIRLLLFTIFMTMIVCCAHLTYRFIELPAREWLRRRTSQTHTSATARTILHPGAEHT
jgi:peptidoglycan/LPS O-acetylase OafA/YrhL